MGTSLCDVTVTLKRERKIVNIFFLKQDTYFYKKMYVWHFYPKMHTELHRGLHYMFDTFTQKCTRNYTGAYTNIPVLLREHSGSMVESLTLDWGATPASLHCVLLKSLLGTGFVEEEPCCHYWTIVDWDVRNQIILLKLVLLRKIMSLKSVYFVRWFIS